MGLTVLEAGALLGCAAPAAYFASRASAPVAAVLARSAALSLLALGATHYGVPTAAAYLARRGIKGRDMGRRGTPAEAVEIPSAVGIVCGVVYLSFVIVFQLVHVKDDVGALANYAAALLSIAVMVLLGFADDVLDLPWRAKLALPLVASFPLVAAYRGGTTVLVPPLLRSALAAADGSGLTPLGALVSASGVLAVDAGAGGATLDLGAAYLVYMLLLAVFATNAINIYAGVNGLEAGQALVVGLAVLTANAVELAAGAGLASPHFFSAQLVLPFLAVTAGVLQHNAYPARVFVGDTFCYFAGMTLASAAVLGHFSKTLLLFLAPQIVNFLYSTPQLFKVYPCPRHRLPAYDAASDTMRPSRFAYEARGADGAVVVREADNMTLVNLTLRALGPLHERTLTNALLALQALCCAAGLYARFAWGPGPGTPA